MNCTAIQIDRPRTRVEYLHGLVVTRPLHILGEIQTQILGTSTADTGGDTFRVSTAVVDGRPGIVAIRIPAATFTMAPIGSTVLIVVADPTHTGVCEAIAAQTRLTIGALAACSAATIGAARLSFTGGLANTLTADALVLPRARSAGALASVGTALFVGAIRVADALAVDTVVLADADPANIPATVGPAFSLVTGGLADALSHDALVLPRARSTLPSAAVGPAVLASAVRWTYTQPALTKVLPTADSTDTATSVWTTVFVSAIGEAACSLLADFSCGAWTIGRAIAAILVSGADLITTEALDYHALLGAPGCFVQGRGKVPALDVV